MKHRNILLTIKIKQNDEEIVTRETLIGTDVYKNNIWYIKMNDSEHSMMPNLIKIYNDGQIKFLFKKHVIKEMLFDEAKETLLMYHINGAPMMFNVLTTHINLILSPLSNHLEQFQIDYQLKQEKDTIGEYQIDCRLL